MTHADWTGWIRDVVNAQAVNVVGHVGIIAGYLHILRLPAVIGLAHVHQVGRVRDVINAQSAAVIGEHRVVARDRHADWPITSIGLADVHRVGRIGNIKDMQPIAAGKVSAVVGHGDAIGVRTIVDVADEDKRDSSGGSHRPIKTHGPGTSTEINDRDRSARWYLISRERNPANQV